MIIRTEKYCPRCKETKPISEFGKNKSEEVDGLTSYCKKCFSQRRKEMKGKGLCRECGKKSREGKILCAKCAEINYAWHKNKNREMKEKGICVNCRKRPAEKDRVSCIICLLKHIARATLGKRSRYEDLKTLWIKQKGICPYLGIKLQIGVNASIDHIIPQSKGGSNDITNLQWVHLSVNKAKMDMLRDEFIDFINKIHENLSHGTS